MARDIRPSESAGMKYASSHRFHTAVPACHLTLPCYHPEIHVGTRRREFTISGQKQGFCAILHTITRFGKNPWPNYCYLFPCFYVGEMDEKRELCPVLGELCPDSMTGVCFQAPPRITLPSENTILYGRKECPGSQASQKLSAGIVSPPAQVKPPPPERDEKFGAPGTLNQL
jgi:hypothetical protein